MMMMMIIIMIMLFIHHLLSPLLCLSKFKRLIVLVKIGITLDSKVMKIHTTVTIKLINNNNKVINNNKNNFWKWKWLLCEQSKIGALYSSDVY